MPEVKPSEVEAFARIKVVGVGGAGGSAVNRMKDAGLTGVEFIVMNTDAQALHNSKADVKVHLGRDTTGGLGAGADPTVGQTAAEESREEIRKAIEGADMAFITLGAGGGTGSGAGYIVAEEAKKAGVMTVGVATRPFTFEGATRKRNAEWAIAKMSREVDTLITIPNDRLLQTIDPRTPLLETFKIADDVLRQGVQGISELITEHGLINLDFADVKAIMKNAGSALMGIGRAGGEGRAVAAAQQAIESPLIEVSIDGAKGVLFNVAGGYDMSMSEIQEAAEVITSAVSPDANIIFGATLRPELEDELIITVVATGFDSAYGGNTLPPLDDEPKEKPADKQQEKRESEAVQSVDMNLEHKNDYVKAPAREEVREVREQRPTQSEPRPASNTFTSDNPRDIWAVSNEKKAESSNDDEQDIPAFLRRRRRSGGGVFGFKNKSENRE